MSRWFLSYNSQDLSLVTQLEAALRVKAPGTTIFFAPKSLRVGGYWLPKLAEEISEASAFILLVGENGLGPWQILEYYEALDRRVKQPEFPVIFVLAQGQPAPGLPFLRQLHWIVTPDAASEHTIAKLADAAAGGGTRPGELWRYTAPYRGLVAMTEADSDFFFGRAEKTAEIVDALVAAPDRIPVLLGNSGVGKSSLAQAGVLASLKRQAWPDSAGAAGWPDALRDSRRWCFLKMQPGTEPLKALTEQFLQSWQFDSTDPQRAIRQNGWIEALLGGSVPLSDLLDATERRYAELGQAKPSAFFLYVDQGEEIYARADAQQQRRFSELLAHGVDDPRLRVMISLRSDFFGALQNDERLYAQHHQINVPPLRESELRDVVSRPAELLSARFETAGLAHDLARRTAEESAMDAGALPLLSYLLDDMWAQMVARGDGVLRLPAEAFELGGVLADRANAFVATHPKAEDQLRRILTLKLATVRENGDPTRRRARRSEFSDEEWRLVSELADHPHRLLVTATPEGGETYAEVAHEAIFRRWEKLRDWMAAEREFLVWRSGLEADRRKWEQAPQASRNDALLMGLALAQAQSWLAKRAEDLARDDREFIDLSLRREILERRQREALRRRVLWTAIVALLVVTVLAAFSVLQWREAERQKVEAEQQRAEAVKQAQVAQQERDRAEQALANVPKSVFAYMGRGMAYLTKGDFDRALQDFAEVLKIEPDNAMAYLGNGLAYTNKGEYDRAIENLNQALKLNPNNAIIYSARGLAYYSKKEYDLAIADYGKAMELDPNNSFLDDWYNNRGNAYYAKGDDDHALVDYTRAIALSPRSALYVDNRGNVYFRKKDYERAIADYDQALKLNPSFADAYNHRGNAQFEKGDYDRAIADYGEAIRLSANNATYYDNRGNAYYRKKDYDRAIADYDQALKINPAFADAHNQRGNVYFDKGDYDRAIADYAEAIRLKSDDPAYYHNRGNAYRNKKSYDLAIVDYDRAIALLPDFARAYEERGNAYMEKGDAVRAISDFGEVIKLEPNNAGVWNERCWARATVGQLQDALADCNESLRLAPDSAMTLDSRGFTYLKLGRLDDAIADYDAALRIDPRVAESLYGRGLAKQRKGDAAGAEADFAAAKKIKPDVGEEFARYGLK
jgi:tetratricopeptide (TPR) repeat protein